MPASESPIIVSGLARSGTTWMQFFLSQHPRIHVHGQTPNVPWSAWWQWYQRLVAQGQWAAESNRHHGYAIAHYAGSDRERSEAVFKRMLRDYLTRYGPDKPRWGLKWVNLAGDREAAGQLTSLWPDARWVVCIRDPFVTIASTRNTFAPGLDLKMRAAAWVEVCRFAWEQEGGRVVVVQIDRLNRESHAERAEAMRRVLECVGEEPCEETDRFVREWPVVHKVKADAKRTFVVSDEERAKLLEEVPGLRAWITRMGYARFAAVPNGPRDGERPASDSLAMTRERGRCSLVRRAARWRLLNKS